MKQDNGEFNCLLPRPESAAVNDWIINNGGLAVVVALDLVLSACDYRQRLRCSARPSLSVGQADRRSLRVLRHNKESKRLSRTGQ